MTKAEIINNTITHYQNNPRSVISGDNEFCYYQSPNDPSKKCAIGRWMKEKYLTHKLADLEDLLDESPLIYNEDLRSVNDLLREEVHGHSLEFWKQLQSLHDNKWFWHENKKKLTNKGIGAVEKIAEDHDISKEDIVVLN